MSDVDWKGSLIRDLAQGATWQAAQTNAERAVNAIILEAQRGQLARLEQGGAGDAAGLEQTIARLERKIVAQDALIEDLRAQLEAHTTPAEAVPSPEAA